MPTKLQRKSGPASATAAGVLGRGQRVGRRRDQVLAVERRRRVVGQREQEAGRDAARVAGPLDLLVVQLLLVEPALDVIVAVRRLDVVTGIFEDLHVGGRRRLRSRLGRQQRLARLLEIELLGRVGARLDLQRLAPAVDGLVLGRQTRRPITGGGELDLRIAGDRIRHGQRVDQPHGVLSLLMDEVIEDAFLLHETADQVEVGLVVLNQVLPLGILVVAEVLLDGDAVGPEPLHDEVGDRRVLVDACSSTPWSSSTVSAAAWRGNG